MFRSNTICNKTGQPTITVFDCKLPTLNYADIAKHSRHRIAAKEPTLATIELTN